MESEEIVRALRERVAELETQAAQQREKLAHAIHDLRSPLTGLLANAEFALDPRSTEADLIRANEISHRNALRLAQLIDELSGEDHSS